jgi:hypothetical protein
MNSFSHLVFNNRGTTVAIKRQGRYMRITIEGSLGERMIIEIDRLAPENLKLEGLTADE